MSVTSELKRQNFNVTPEQEAELLSLQTELAAPSVKDAILRAARLVLTLTRAARPDAHPRGEGREADQLERPER